MKWSVSEEFSGRYDMGKEFYEFKITADRPGILPGLVKDLQWDAENVHEEIRRRIGLGRSLLAVVNRFKNRCEWHDRDRLLGMAQGETRKAEDLLTADLARFLFDQGLNPLTKPMTAGLQPDLLSKSPSGWLYVESKRYSASPRPIVIKAVAQVFDTVGRLRGSKFEAHEGFLVVFRLDRPYCVMPASVPCAGLTLYPILIDIAPSSVSGSKQKRKPVVITLEEIFAEVADSNCADHARDKNA